MIDRISGLENLVNLRTLNLSDNMLTRVDGLSCLKMLENLQLKRNRIGRSGGVEEALGLVECPSLTCVDISDNYIEDEGLLEEVWVKLPKIAVIYMQGNPCIKKMRNYRKTMISTLPTLKYLDDRPVFEDDRKFAEAWSRGGLDEERKEREKVRKEKEDEHWRNHDAFTEMIKKAREEKRLADEAKKAALLAA